MFKNKLFLSQELWPPQVTACCLAFSQWWQDLRKWYKSPHLTSSKEAKEAKDVPKCWTSPFTFLYLSGKLPTLAGPIYSSLSCPFRISTHLKPFLSTEGAEETRSRASCGKRFQTVNHSACEHTEEIASRSVSFPSVWACAVCCTCVCPSFFHVRFSYVCAVYSWAPEQQAWWLS